MASRRASGPAAGCPELGLPVGSQVDNKVMERLYGAFIDPRDPEHEATLGRAPSGFAGNNDKVAARIAGAARGRAGGDAGAPRPDHHAGAEGAARRGVLLRRDVLGAQVGQPAARIVAGQGAAGPSGWPGRARRSSGRRGLRRCGTRIMAGNQAMLDYLQREAGYSRAGYHSKGSGRFVDAHEWVIASFAQHTSRDNDPQLHVHNAILNRVLREDPLASRPGDRRAWRTLDGAALYAAKPAAGRDRRADPGRVPRRPARRARRSRGRTGTGGRSPASPRRCATSSPRAAAPSGRGVQQLIEEYERRHGKAPNARAVWSMAQFVTLDSRRAKAHSAPSREALLAQWEAQSRRAETEALSAIPDAALGRRGAGRAARPAVRRAACGRILAAAVADAQRRKATFSRYELTRMINRYLPDFLGGLSGDAGHAPAGGADQPGAAARRPGRGRCC